MKRGKLQFFRKSEHLTKEQMTSKLEITVAHYKSIECGQRNPSFELIERIKITFPKVNSGKFFLI